MNNNWIRHLAADIADRFNRPQAERMVEDVIREAVRANMPDAAPDLLDAGHNLFEVMADTGYYNLFKPQLDALRTAIAAHRAAHPAHVSTNSVLGNK